MKKKREITLKLKRSKIANLNAIYSIKGGTGTYTCNNTGDPGTDDDTRRDCAPNPAPNNTGTGIPGMFTVTCLEACPSVLVTALGC